MIPARKDAPLLASDGTRLSGYASLFGVADAGGDVVAPGAYARSLKRTAEARARVRMLWQHDPREPIGLWEDVREDARGLWVEGRLLLDVERGREAAALLSAGAIDGLSIGYRPVRAAKDGQGRRLLQEVDLWEVSLVTFPMLASARAGAGHEGPPRAGAGHEGPACAGATPAAKAHPLHRALAEARRRIAP